MDPYLFKHLLRKPWNTVSSIVFCTAICCLICFLSTYAENQEKELKNVQENMAIKCVVTNARGNQTTELGIRAKYINFVMDESSPFHKYVKDIETTKEFYDGNSGIDYIGISSETCSDDLNPAMGGSYVTDIDFMNSSDFVCIVPESQYEALNGKTLTVDIYDPRARNEDMSIRHKVYDFQVVGYYPGDSSTVYIPIKTAINMASSIAMNGNYKIEEMSFTVKDNTLLDEMKKAALDVFVEAKPENDRISVYFALVFYDSNYLTTVSTLKQSIESTKFLVPFIMLLGLGLGFIISFLSTRSENRRYALMRAIGMTKGKLFFSVLREQSVIPLTVAVLTAIIFTASIPALEFFLFYEIGCIVAVIRAVSVRPMTILRED